MTYDKGSWGTYAWDPSKTREENLLSAERLGAAVTKSKMDNIEDGIENAHIKNRELEQVKADKVELQNLDNKKADNNRVDSLEQEKADITFVESMAEGQVNNIDFDNARKEDKNYVATEIDRLDKKKADKDKLEEDIGNVTAQLAQTDARKIDKGTVSINDMDTELLEVIEGGEGTSFNIENIPRDYSVTPTKTTFAKKTKNLFEGNYYDGVISYHEPDGVREWGVRKNFGNNYGKIAIIPIQDSQTYTIKVHEPSLKNRFRVALSPSFPEFGDTSGDYVVTVIVDDSTLNQYTLTNEENAKYLLVYVSSQGHEPKLQVEKGSIATAYEVPFYLEQDLIAIDDISFDVLDKKNLYVKTKITNVEIGSLVVTSTTGREGDEVSANNRVRTGFLKADKDYRLQLTSPENMDFRILYYDDDFNYIEANPKPIADYLKDDTVVMEHNGYVRAVIRYKNNEIIDNIEEFEGVIELSYSLRSGIEQLEDRLEKNEIEGSVSSEVVPNFYQSEDVKRVPFPSNTSEMYVLYDDIVSRNPSYVKKEVQGHDSLDNPINVYTFKPSRIPEITTMYGDSEYVEGNIDPVKIIIVSGVHGNEKGSVQAIYNFFNQLCDEWSTNGILRYLRFNVEFIVVPIVNPSGYDSNRRLNHNDVNLNRNFQSSTEPEIVAIRELIGDNLDADYFIDSHNTNPNIGMLDDLDKYVMTNHVTDDQNIKVIGANVIAMLTEKWKIEYPEIKTASDNYYDINGVEQPLGVIIGSVTGSASDYAQGEGIPSLLLELESYDIFNNNQLNNNLVVNISLDTVATTIIAMVKNLGSNDTQYIM